MTTMPHKDYNLHLQTGTLRSRTIKLFVKGQKVNEEAFQFPVWLIRNLKSPLF